MLNPSPIILPPSVAHRRRARWASIAGALAFGRHYLEMVLAMGLGMLVLAWPLDAALGSGVRIPRPGMKARRSSRCWPWPSP